MTDFQSTQQSPAPVKRSLFVRILCGVLWLVPIHFLVFGLAGGIAGAMSTSQLPKETPASIGEAYNQGAQVGREAGHKLIRAHGGKLFLLVFGLTGVLSYTGFLPGTGPNKRRKG